MIMTVSMFYTYKYAFMLSIGINIKWYYFLSICVSKFVLLFIHNNIGFCGSLKNRIVDGNAFIQFMVIEGHNANEQHCKQ